MTMYGHVLLQIPFVIGIGYFYGWCLKPDVFSCFDQWNRNGVPGIIIASTTIAFWMIPRWLDAAVTDWVVEVMKYFSLIFLVGVPLANSWERLNPVARGVVKIEVLSMLFRLGWLYAIAPIRFCNNYLLEDQAHLGLGLIATGAALGVAWLVPVFFTDVRDQTSGA
jgi:hypothetical protein